MDLQLKDKTALVTGASQGIGRAIARGLAAEGVKVCIAARRRSLLDTLAQEITAAGGITPAIVETDIMLGGAPQRLADAAHRALGRIDILINSAGGSRPAIPIDAPEAEWEDVMTLNFVRVRQLTHAVLPDMISHQWGRVINISGKSEPDALLAASPAKATVHAWSKGLSRTVGKHGITVNCIPPGRIMSEQIRRKYSDEFRARESAHGIPVGRYGEPEELAALAVFLASPVACYITGAVLPVDGGLRRFAFAIALTPAMIAVIFEVWPAEGRQQEYLDIAAGLRPLLEQVDGFISIERFESLSEPGKILSLSVFRDEAAVARWRALEQHRAAQTQGRGGIFRDYRLRVASVIRDYGLTDRAQAPRDSRCIHD